MILMRSLFYAPYTTSYDEAFFFRNMTECHLRIM